MVSLSIGLVYYLTNYYSHLNDTFDFEFYLDQSRDFALLYFYYTRYICIWIKLVENFPGHNIHIYLKKLIERVAKY